MRADPRPTGQPWRAQEWHYCRRADRTLSALTRAANSHRIAIWKLQSRQVYTNGIQPDGTPRRCCGHHWSRPNEVCGHICSARIGLAQLRTGYGPLHHRQWPGYMWCLAEFRQNGTVHQGQVIWVLGFLTGSNYRTEGQGAPADSAAVEAFIDQYCQNNPSHQLFMAAAALVQDSGGFERCTNTKNEMEASLHRHRSRMATMPPG